MSIKILQLINRWQQ